MAKEYPTWLNENFLETVLQGGEDKKSQLTVLDFSAKPAVAAGTNYTSNLYRVLVEYKTGASQGDESITLIVKAPIQEGSIHEFAEAADVSGKENIVYGEVLPKMFEKIKCKFGPKSFYSPVKRVLILKDMNPEGYIMCDRFEQLDLVHCKQVVVALAKFHATSVALHHEDSELIETAGEENVYKHGPYEVLKLWIEAAVEYTADILNEMGGHQPTVDLLMSKADQIWESIIDACKPKTSHFNVLNHGDCWINNILFKYNASGEVTDMKFIDFQLTRYASPVLDLIYFFWSSTDDEVRENHHQELHSIYLQTLNNALEELGCEERLTSEELHEDLKSATDWALAIICFAFPFFMCEPEHTIDMASISSEELNTIKTNEKFIKMYSGKHYRVKLPVVVRQAQAWVSSFK